MVFKIDPGRTEALRAMDQKIREIEAAVLELKELGQGLPMVEKNAESIKSFIRALKFGISDLAGVLEREES